MSAPDNQSSILLAELKRRAVRDMALQWMIQGGAPLTADEYKVTQWLGDVPEEIDPEEAESIALLEAYEQALQRESATA